MFSFRIKKKIYIFLMLCSATSVLLLSFGCNNLMASTNTKLVIIHLVSSNQASEVTNNPAGLNLINNKTFKTSNNLMRNQPLGVFNKLLGINANSRQNLTNILRAIFQFLRVCSNINQQCIPSFFSWIWSLITNPFTWVVGLIIFVSFCKS